MFNPALLWAQGSNVRNKRWNIELGSGWWHRGANNESPLQVQRCVWQLWGKFCWRSFTHSPLLIHFSMFEPSLELMFSVSSQTADLLHNIRHIIIYSTEAFPSAICCISCFWTKGKITPSDVNLFSDSVKILLSFVTSIQLFELDNLYKSAWMETWLCVSLFH